MRVNVNSHNGTKSNHTRYKMHVLLPAVKASTTCPLKQIKYYKKNLHKTTHQRGNTFLASPTIYCIYIHKPTRAYPSRLGLTAWRCLQSIV